MCDSRTLLHRRAGIDAGSTGDVMTDHAGLIRAEHVLTARTGANRGRRHVVSDQGWADSSTRGHGERVPASHERRRRETGEQFVDETGLQDGAKRWRGARRSWTTQRTQKSGRAPCRDREHISEVAGAVKKKSGELRGGRPRQIA